MITFLVDTPPHMPHISLINKRRFGGMVEDEMASEIRAETPSIDAAKAFGLGPIASSIPEINYRNGRSLVAGLLAGMLAVKPVHTLSHDSLDYDYRPYRVGRNHKKRVRPRVRSIRGETTNTHRVNRPLTADRRKANVRRMQATA